MVQIYSNTVFPSTNLQITDPITDCCWHLPRSQNSLNGTETAAAGESRCPGYFAEKARYFYLLQNFKMGSLTHSYSCITGIWGPSAGVKLQTRKSYHASHILQSLEMSGSIPPFPYISSFRAQRQMYEGHLESKERFAIQRYLLIIGKKKNMQVLWHTFTYFST